MGLLLYWPFWFVVLVDLMYDKKLYIFGTRRPAHMVTWYKTYSWYVSTVNLCKFALWTLWTMDDRTQFIWFVARPFAFAFQVLFVSLLFTNFVLFFWSMCWCVRCDSRWMEWNGIIRIASISVYAFIFICGQLNGIRWREEENWRYH